MTVKHLTALAACIPPLLPAHAHAALVRLAAALLAAGDMALWLGAGRKILAASWEVSSPAPSDFDPGSGSTPEQDAGTAKCAFALALHGALADPALAWGGWRAVGLPLVAHAITGSAAAPSLLDAEPRRFGAFLARLARAGRLGEGEGDAWAARLGRWVEARLAAWDAGAAGAVEELGVLLALARFAGAEAEVGGCLRGIVRRGLDAGARADADAAWVVGATLSALAAVWGRAGGADGAGAEVAEWVQRAAEKFAGSHIVLCGLVDVVNARYVYPALCACLRAAESPPHTAPRRRRKSRCTRCTRTSRPRCSRTRGPCAWARCACSRAPRSWRRAPGSARCWRARCRARRPRWTCRACARACCASGAWRTACARRTGWARRSVRGGLSVRTSSVE